MTKHSHGGPRKGAGLSVGKERESLRPDELAIDNFQVIGYNRGRILRGCKKMGEHNDTMVEAIALSSPSGHMSKRARKAAEERLRVKLFGPNGMPRPKARESTPQEQAAILRQRAADLRRLADGGMRPRVHRREAVRLEQEADELERAEEDMITRPTQAKAER